MRIAIEGGRVLLPDGSVEKLTVTLAEEGIVGVGHAIAASRFWHVPGLLLLPGIVDLHGDAFEKQLMPRNGVRMPHQLALQATDRHLLASGITTAFHGLTVSWEPGLRSVAAAREFIAELEAVRPHLDCDTRLHLRFETHTTDAVAEVLGWIAAGRVDLLAFNDHSGYIARIFEDERGHGTYLGRSGLDTAGYRRLLDEVRGRAPEVPAAVAALARAAGERRLPLASHDDDSPLARERWRALGCRLCEFPYDAATAEAAVAAGDRVVMGAPNVVRGRSHARRLSGHQAVGDGLCAILTSDYYYPALPAAPLRLAAEGVLGLGAAWRLVSAAPAAAAGLDDRGEIAVGKRADLVLVDDSTPGLPKIAATIAGGRIAHVGDARLAMSLERFSGASL